MTGSPFSLVPKLGVEHLGDHVDQPQNIGSIHWCVGVRLDEGEDVASHIAAADGK